VVGGFEVVGEGRAFALCLRLAQGFELVAALLHELVVVLQGSGRFEGGGVGV